MDTPARHWQWMIAQENAGVRLDVFLSQQVQNLSRSHAAQEIRQGRVDIRSLVKHRTIKPGTLLQAGDEVHYTCLPPQPSSLIAEAIPLSVLYQDKDIAVVNKPAGMVTHPAAGHFQGTLVHALLFHLDQLSGLGGEQRPGIVHRLDKDTSGLLLVAKHDQSHQALSAALQAHQIIRHYDAIVWGKVPVKAGFIENQLGRQARDRKCFQVVRGRGKLAKTHFWREERFRDFTRLRLQLDTGRTHQIRIHCHFLGYPVVGDRSYGKRNEAKLCEHLGLVRPARQLLHAKSLTFQHPCRPQAMYFEAPWPEDFETFIQALRQNNFMNPS